MSNKNAERLAESLAQRIQRVFPAYKQNSARSTIITQSLVSGKFI